MQKLLMHVSDGPLCSAGVCHSLKEKVDIVMKCQSLLSVTVLSHCKGIHRAWMLF